MARAGDPDGLSHNLTSLLSVIMARAGDPHGLSNNHTSQISVIMARAWGEGPDGLSHNLTSTVSDHGKGWGSSWPIT